MPKTLMLAMILVLSAPWLQAQQDTQAGSSKTDSGSAQTVEGCLQGSSGNFTLTDSSGTTYQLAGDTSKLTEHVGHEVQIKGSTSAPSPAGASSGAPAGGQQTLTVESVKHVSKTCKSAGAK